MMYAITCPHCNKYIQGIDMFKRIIHCPKCKSKITLEWDEAFTEDYSDNWWDIYPTIEKNAI